MLFENRRSCTKQNKEENCHNLQHLEKTLRRNFKSSYSFLTENCKIKKIIFRTDKTKVARLFQIERYLRNVFNKEISKKRDSQKEKTKV